MIMEDLLLCGGLCCSDGEYSRRSAVVRWREGEVLGGERRERVKQICGELWQEDWGFCQVWDEKC